MAILPNAPLVNRTYTTGTDGLSAVDCCLLAVAMIAIPHWKSNQDLDTEKPEPLLARFCFFWFHPH